MKKITVQPVVEMKWTRCIKCRDLLAPTSAMRRLFRILKGNLGKVVFPVLNPKIVYIPTVSPTFKTPINKWNVRLDFVICVVLIVKEYGLAILMII